MQKILLLTLFLLLGIACSSPVDAYTVRIFDKAGVPVKNTVIALKPLIPSDTYHGLVVRNSEIKQVDFMFEPRVSIAQKGASVRFPNFDNTHHHVYSFSEAKKFSLPLYKNSSPMVVFEKEGVVSLACNIHDWMLAYLVVVDTPYFGVTNEGGYVDILDVPEGDYMVSYWHPGLDPSDGLQNLGGVGVKGGGHAVFKLDLNHQIQWPQKPRDYMNSGASRGSFGVERRNYHH